MKTFTTEADLVTAFIAGEAEGAFGNLLFKGGDFFNGGVQYAKRGPDGDILLGKASDVSDDINDTFLSRIIGAGKTFKRIGNFNTLLNTQARLTDLKEGRFDTLKLIGGIFGFDFGSVNTSVYAEKEAMEARHKAEQEALNKRITEVEGGVVSFFAEKERERVKLLQEAELAAMDEKVRAATTAWDEGGAMDLVHSYVNGSYELLVKGAGGGTRLRTIMRGGTSPRMDVQGTTGQRTTLNQLKRAFNLVAPYVFGGKNPAPEGTYYHDSYNNRGRAVSVGTAGQYDITLTKKVANMGCQTVTFEELSRFATIQGWPLDGSEAA